MELQVQYEMDFWYICLNKFRKFVYHIVFQVEDRATQFVLYSHSADYFLQFFVVLLVCYPKKSINLNYNIKFFT